MFSGIIEKTAEILEVRDGLFRMENSFSESLMIGQSIAHDGACMTIIEADAYSYAFFAMQESFRMTNF